MQALYYFATIFLAFDTSVDTGAYVKQCIGGILGSGSLKHVADDDTLPTFHGEYPSEQQLQSFNILQSIAQWHFGTTLQTAS